MSRWIEVEPLIDLSISVLCGGGNEEMAVLVEDIDSAPTIDIVRCKDCKHNPKYTDDYMYGRCVFCCEDDYYAGTPSDDFYCGYGERKESE